MYVRIYQWEKWVLCMILIPKYVLYWLLQYDCTHGGTNYNNNIWLAMYERAAKDKNII